MVWKRSKGDLNTGNTIRTSLTRHLHKSGYISQHLLNGNFTEEQLLPAADVFEEQFSVSGLDFTVFPDQSTGNGLRFSINKHKRWNTEEWLKTYVRSECILDYRLLLVVRETNSNFQEDNRGRNDNFEIYDSLGHTEEYVSAYTKTTLTSLKDFSFKPSEHTKNKRKCKVKRRSTKNPRGIKRKVPKEVLRGAVDSVE